MKFKHVISSVALAMVTAFALAAGLAQPREAKEVRADGEWLFSAVLDLNTSGTEIPTYDGFDGSSIKFKCWNNSDYDGSVKMFDMHQTGVENVYMVIAKFESSYTFDRVQFRYTETSGDKYSEAHSETFSSASVNKCIRGYNWLGGWTDGTWDLALSKCEAPSFNDGSSVHLFEQDVANTRYKLTNIDLAADAYANFFFDLATNGYVPFIRDTCSNNIFKGVGTTWAQVDTSCRVDIFLENSYSDGGVIELKVHGEPSETYIYYVLENNTPTNDYIYAWGGSQQFGAWPGKKLVNYDELQDKYVPAEGVEEVTNNGVLHFQGSETPKLIYKIQVSVGYPVGDDQFKFNNNDNWESEARPINGHNAYWYTGNANSLAGYAIDFLVMAEGIRNAASNTSVCNISKSNAELIVNQYLSLGAAMQEDYIDCTTVYTHKRDKSEGNELVSYRAIIEELAAKAEINLPGASSLKFNALASFDLTVTVIIVTMAISSMAIVVTLVAKKRKQQ